MSSVNGSTLASVIFLVFFAIVAGAFIVGMLRGLDQVGRPSHEKKAILVKKWIVWTNRFDMNFRPIHHYYGKVSIDRKIYTVRIHEGDFDNLHNGEWHTVTLVTGWSGNDYAIMLKP
jgi:hypothetical protein